MQILHLVITHIAPEKVAQHLALTEAFAPGVPRLIAYGGPQSSFDALPGSNKFFLEDASIRGPVTSQCFNELFPKTWRYIQAQGIPFDFMHVSEFDHLILSRNYFDCLKDVIARSAGDFIGKNCGIKTNSNWMHLFRYRDDPTFLNYLSRVSVREDKTAICSTFGNGFTISSRALQAMAELESPPPVYNEVFFPTLVHHLGFKICDIGTYSNMFRHVRWQPYSPEEVRKQMLQGVPCCHPFKDIDAAQKILGCASVEP